MTLPGNSAYSKSNHFLSKCSPSFMVFVLSSFRSTLAYRWTNTCSKPP